MSEIDALYQPLRLKGLNLPNRIVMAPMTRGFSPNGVPTEAVAQYYAKRASAEVGLIVSECTGVNRVASRNNSNYPSFFGNDALAGWKGVIDAVHSAGGRMAPQLWHAGALDDTANPGKTPEGHPFESPSGLRNQGDSLGATMSEEDIADTIEAFAQAALDAKQLGFDTVEFHAAHGYLIDQFFWAATNQRSDKYGGPTIAERTRFASEIIRAVRKKVGPEFPIIIRLSQWKIQQLDALLVKTPADLSEWLSPLVDAGVDVLHCSQRRYWEPFFEGSDLNFAGWAKKLTGLTTITVGSVGLSGDVQSSFAGESSKFVGLGDLLRRFDRGDFDLVAIGRALLQDPQWVAKVHHGRFNELSDFNPASMGSLS